MSYRLPPICPIPPVSLHHVSTRRAALLEWYSPTPDLSWSPVSAVTCFSARLLFSKRSSVLLHGSGRRTCILSPWVTLVLLITLKSVVLTFERPVSMLGPRSSWRADRGIEDFLRIKEDVTLPSFAVALRLRWEPFLVVVQIQESSFSASACGGRRIQGLSVYRQGCGRITASPGVCIGLCLNFVLSVAHEDRKGGLSKR